MTKSNAIQEFVSNSSSYSDYWEMQICWETFMDGLCSDGVITERQRNNWGNPTTPERFESWKRKHGL